MSGAGFVLESPRVLRIDLGGAAWVRPGAALAPRGEVVFERRRTLEAESLADALGRETVPLVRAIGRAQLYCGWHGRHFRLVRLTGERLVVAAEELIAFEDSLAFEPAIVKNGVGLAAGGLMTVVLTGTGHVAIGVHGDVVALPVAPDAPVSTDPLATVAWSGTLEPRLQVDLTWRTLVGHGGGEPIHMRFEGSGSVLVQPFKDDRRWRPEHLLAGAMKRVVPIP